MCVTTYFCDNIHVLLHTCVNQTYLCRYLPQEKVLRLGKGRGGFMNSITNEGAERLLKISLDMFVGLPQGPPGPLEGTLFTRICNENILDLCVCLHQGPSLEGTLSRGNPLHRGMRRKQSRRVRESFFCPNVGDRLDAARAASVSILPQTALGVAVRPNWTVLLLSFEL